MQSVTLTVSCRPPVFLTNGNNSFLVIACVFTSARVFMCGEHLRVCENIVLKTGRDLSGFWPY